jgi:hypothetical protein
MARTHFSADDARQVGAEIGVDWDSAPFDRTSSAAGWTSSSSTVVTTRRPT